MKKPLAYPVRFLLMTICEKPDRLSTTQRSSAGLTARRILEFANTRDRLLVRSGIEAVCRTYESDPIASQALLAKFLQREHLESFGFEDMPVLAREIGRLISIAPEFVRDTYVAAFSFGETRTDQTAMGPGRIVPLTSNRRQDYDHGLWQLGEFFPAFLSGEPDYAIDALSAAISAGISDQRIREEGEIKAFELKGVKCRIKADNSYIWDASSAHRHEPHEKMLDAFETELDRLASDPNLATAKERLLCAVAKSNEWAAVWRRVLICGARNPDQLGRSLISMVTSLPILTGPDTSTDAGNLIKSVYPSLSPEDRERTEKAILSISTAIEPEKAEIANRLRNRLLGCIPQNLIFTEEAKKEIEKLNAEGGPPPNRPFFQISSGLGGRFTEEDLLERQGVPVKEESNRVILERSRPIQAFNTKYSQGAPPMSDVQSIFPQVIALRAALERGQHSGAHEVQIETGWMHLIAFCAIAVRAREFDCSTEVGRQIKELLLFGAKNQNPQPNERWDTQFDDHPSWSPAPRIDAAEGLLVLSSHPTCRDDSVLSEIERLSEDLVPAVRLQIADHLSAIAKSAPDVRDRVLKRMLEQDISSPVVLSLLNNQVHTLPSDSSDEARQYAEAVYKRTNLRGEVAKAVKQSCVTLFLRSFLWSGDTNCEQLLRSFAENALSCTDEAECIVQSLREILVIGTAEPSDKAADAARLRSFGLLESIVTSARRGYQDLWNSNKRKGFSDWSKEDQEKGRDLVQLLDSISSQLYFASGAFADKQNAANPTESSVTIEQKKRFLREAGKLFEMLSAEAHPSTVHQMIDTLQSLMEINPREVFLRIAAIVNAGKTGGYQYESLAIDQVVNVVNRIFADYRPLLQEHKDVRDAMVSLLDIFVEVGWPKAIQLTYRLEEIFR